MNKIAENLEEIQKNFDKLNMLNIRVVMEKVITKSYEEMSFFFRNYRKILINQKDMIKTHMKDFFKYINLEGKAYKELIQRREELKSKYITDNKRLVEKKEKIYSAGDINKFELGNQKNVDRNRLLRDKPYAFECMCKDDTENLNKIYNQLGYANIMNMRELKKLIKEYCVRYVENIKKFNEKFYSSINDLVGTWSNMETFVVSANASKII